MHRKFSEVTARVRKRSAAARAEYLKKTDAAAAKGASRASLSCGNLAHGFAACGPIDKARIIDGGAPNIGIITAYNDMLSAHQPYGAYPEQLRAAARTAGATAQVAGGTPAMCDGITQGREGMQLSLFSRDLIAQATAVGLSHNMFDAALLLGICDKIVPGLLIGALSFGHLPCLFVPGGPMPSGLPNAEKARVRMMFAQGKATRKELLKVESGSYHSAGTCTFFGTANSNQMFMEVMGLHLPGSTFINPSDPLRRAFTSAAAYKAAELARTNNNEMQLARIVDERAIINAIAALLATGGSTNHTIHLVAIAKAAGITIDWQDFEDLSSFVPLLARIYPNGSADVNTFRNAGGIAFVISELASAGMLHDDAMTVCGPGLTDHYLAVPQLANGSVRYEPWMPVSGDKDVLRPADDPFADSGGIRLLTGNLGRGIIKVSAVERKHRSVSAPAMVFSSQDQLLEALSGGLDRDLVAVVRFQGVYANGMPELHKLSPSLAVLLSRGRKIALVTDGRMSGASGSVPAAIHMSPEAAQDGPLALIRNGDLIELDCEAGNLNIAGIDRNEFFARTPATSDLQEISGCGRELFKLMRENASIPEQGASIFL